MNILDLYVLMNKNRTQMHENIIRLRTLGNRLSEAECTYKKVQYNTVRKLQSEEKIGWTVLERLVHGHPDVAEARLTRDKIKQEYYSYLRENKVLYQEIQIQEAMLERDYKLKRGNA